MILKSNFLLLVYLTIAVIQLDFKVTASGSSRNLPGQIKPPYYPPRNRPVKQCTRNGPTRCARSIEDVEEMASYGIENEHPAILNPRFRRSAAGFDDKGFRDFTPNTNTRGSIHSSKNFGPNSHGGWESTAKVEHDFWKSNDGNHRISGFVKHDRIDGGRFDGFKDTSGGVGYQGRFRRSAAGFDDKGFRDFTPNTNTRGSIHSSKNFGPNSHGGWESTAKVEHDFWKSNNGNHRISGFVKHDRIDGGRFNGFKDTSGGVGYEGRFRRSAEESNTRGMLHSSKSFGPNSHGGWQSTAKVEHDFWKSRDGNHRISGFVKHDRIDGGRFNGFKDTSGGVGYEGRFRRSIPEDEEPSEVIPLEDV